ncbi:hypothetical protein [Streptomyces sp. H27-H5]|uniref:hypothetical protein n=1 Tax=Streptomyces sp. H27-H5 TaxID=2996460 RepID=UPI00226DFE9C|nr:hypothetical protein [Streptomyces sp. H27-H5]MCY0957703.1 hypothetical protein [Streptomyces sp. H27-H5]
MNTTAKTAQLMTRLATAETTAKTAGREETATAGKATRAAARVTATRTALATARRDLRTATRTGNGQAPAARRVTRLEDKLAGLVDAARTAKAEAAAARRAARTATRRLDALGRRAATSAARTVERIAHRLGETSLTPAAELDRVLTAEEIPAVEEIENRAAQFTDLDQRAKNLTKQADAVKSWLRTLPVGVYGRVIITRTPGRSVLDSTQVAVDYAARGAMPPRKATRTTFKCDATALLVADLAA